MITPLLLLATLSFAYCHSFKNSKLTLNWHKETAQRTEMLSARCQWKELTPYLGWQNDTIIVAYKYNRGENHCRKRNITKQQQKIMAIIAGWECR